MNPYAQRMTVSYALEGWEYMQTFRMSLAYAEMFLNTMFN